MTAPNMPMVPVARRDPFKFIVFINKLRQLIGSVIRKPVSTGQD
jgi:hypothetical protein